MKPRRIVRPTAFTRQVAAGVFLAAAVPCAFMEHGWAMGLVPSGSLTDAQLDSLASELKPFIEDPNDVKGSPTPCTTSKIPDLRSDLTKAKSNTSYGVIIWTLDSPPTTPPLKATDVHAVSAVNATTFPRKFSCRVSYEEHHTLVENALKYCNNNKKEFASNCFILKYSWISDLWST